MAASSPEVDGGTGSSATGGGAADTAEATEGEIVVNNVGANFFAFSKKRLHLITGVAMGGPSRSSYRVQEKVQ
jgi:hypothetical protein